MRGMLEFQADIPQITSKSIAIVPTFPRQRNGIPSAALRLPDLGGLTTFGRPFGQVFHHPDALLLSFSPCTDFLGLRRSGAWSQIINQAQDFLEQAPRHRHLSQLERDVLAMAHDLGANLDQLLSQYERLPLRVKSRRTGAPPGRSAPGGEADEIGAKADIGARMTRAAILALVLALGPAVALASASASAS